MVFFRAVRSTPSSMPSWLPSPLASLAWRLWMELAIFPVTSSMAISGAICQVVPSSSVHWSGRSGSQPACFRRSCSTVIGPVVSFHCLSGSLCLRWFQAFVQAFVVALLVLPSAAAQAASHSETASVITRVSGSRFPKANQLTTVVLAPFPLPGAEAAASALTFFSLAGPRPADWAPQRICENAPVAKSLGPALLFFPICFSLFFFLRAFAKRFKCVFFPRPFKPMEASTPRSRTWEATWISTPASLSLAWIFSAISFLDAVIADFFPEVLKPSSESPVVRTSAVETKPSTIASSEPVPACARSSTCSAKKWPGGIWAWAASRIW